MKRDLSLIRELMLKLEALPLGPGMVPVFQPPYSELAVDGFSDDEIDYHLDQIRRSGFIDDFGARPMVGFAFVCLTPAGHDYLDAVRDPKVWKETKTRAEKAGGWTLGMIKDIGVAVIKGELQKHGLPIG